MSLDLPGNLDFLPFRCRYLISQGANVGGVNSEGETPLDIAEEEAMEELLQNEINKQGIFCASPHLHRDKLCLIYPQINVFTSFGDPAVTPEAHSVEYNSCPDVSKHSKNSDGVGC